MIKVDLQRVMLIRRGHPKFFLINNSFLGEFYADSKEFGVGKIVGEPGEYDTCLKNTVLLTHSKVAIFKLLFLFSKNGDIDNLSLLL